MRTFECCIRCYAAGVPQEIIRGFVSSTARDEGFLLENEEFPEHAIWKTDTRKNPYWPGECMFFISVIVPEPDDRIDEFMSLLEGVNLC